MEAALWILDIGNSIKILYLDIMCKVSDTSKFEKRASVITANLKRMII